MDRPYRPAKIQCPDPASFAVQLNTFDTYGRRFNRTDLLGGLGHIPARPTPAMLPHCTNLCGSSRRSHPSSPMEATPQEMPETGRGFNGPRTDGVGEAQLRGVVSRVHVRRRPWQGNPCFLFWRSLPGPKPRTTSGPWQAPLPFSPHPWLVWSGLG